ncbi:MAG: MFS transporter [Promethearchaeota archaeon]
MNAAESESHPIDTSEKSAKAIARKSIFKKFWPVFTIQAIVSLSVAGLMLNMLGLSRVIWPADDLHAFQMGVIASSKSILLAFMGLIFGYLSDRFARKKILSLSLLIMGIAKFTNGFVSLGDSNTTFFQFIFWYALVGFGQGGISPSITSWSSDAIDAEERSQFFGVLETTRQLMVIVGMIFSALLIQVGLWRVYFWCTGIFLLLGSIFAALIVSEPKRGVKHHELKKVLTGEGKAYEFQLNKETIRETILSKTNIIAFVEGIFTWILFSIAIFLVYPFVQSEPHNIAPVSSSVLMIIFGIPGAVFGSIAFSKLSDKLAARDIRNRIYLIIFSMVTLFVVVILLFVVPLPHLTPEEGAQLVILVKYPVFLALGGLIFVLRAVLGIYNINQTPILQKINLPEAQGTISSWNQLLETLGFGLGPLISGAILEAFSSNYVITAISAMMFGIPAMFMWLLANKWIKGDIKKVDEILKGRAREMANDDGASE